MIVAGATLIPTYGKLDRMTKKSVSDIFDNFDSYLSEFSVSVLGVDEPPEEDIPMFEEGE